MARAAKKRDASRTPDNVVRPRAFRLTDEQLVVAVLAGKREGRRVIFDRYCEHVRRVLIRLLGHDDEIADAVHDVFIEALRSLPKLKERHKLKAWLTRIAVFTARGRIRRASRRRWLRLLPPEAIPDVALTDSGQREGREALRATYAVLTKLPADERIAFTLRFIDGMELSDTAAACSVSLATIKRRLGRAEKRFVAIAQRHPLLSEWLQEGTRWDIR